jgi:2-keto-4-pentenoate hydratase/2-oxohepta-3-ene-1,7-dioic acid hydratase in catechol pathway
MSGTPHGVVFHGVPTQQKVAGLFAWLMGGWGQSVPFHAIEAYIDDAKAARIYLQPGDRVVIHTDRLGVIENIITR